MTNMPLVSVVMPVYNVSKYLRQAIESVLDQTYRNLELIMIDDCSSDESLQIMKEYARKDDRIVVLANDTNQGVASTRNKGIQAARGEYIALLDSDDFWVADKLEKQIALMEQTKADIAYCSLCLIGEDGQQKKHMFIVPEETDLQMLLYRCCFTCTSIVCKTALLKEHPFRTDFYHEDFLLYTELMSLPVKAVGTKEVLAYYRQISGSRSNNKLHAAQQRWKIYRDALGMGLWETIVTFVRYAFWGVRKYYL